MGLICIKWVCLPLCESVVVRTVRVFLLLLLSLAIPVYGYAGMGALESPCSMAPSITQHAASGHDTATDAHALCCDDAEWMADTDHPPCKAGQECGGGGHSWLVATASLRLQAPQRVLHPVQADLALEADRSRVWRPPAPL